MPIFEQPGDQQGVINNVSSPVSLPQISEFFSGPMCTETEAHSWIERLLPETHLPPAGDDDIKLELEEFTRK